MKCKSFLVLIVFIFFISCATENSLRVYSYTAPSEKIIDETSIKIAVISDSHSQNFKDGGKLIIDKIKEAEPDLLFLAGDIIDDKLPIIGSEIFLNNLKSEIPMYYVSGNHEYAYKDVEGAFALIEESGAALLADSFLETEVNNNKIIIAGADEPLRKYFYDKEYNWREAAEKSFSVLIERKEYKILLVHRPDFSDFFLRYGFDLIISGHTHGGQWRIPALLNGLYAPGQGLFPKFAGGLYRLNGAFLIVSRGLTTKRPGFRIFNPPEIVIIEIKRL